MKNFPENFWWGAAASAPQTEGDSLSFGKSPSTWDYWYQTNPEKFFQNVGPKDTSKVYKFYKEDVQRMKEMSFNSYRTSIAWTRLLPDGQTLNPEAVTFYRNYFTELKQNNIEPIVNLFHFDMPMWLMKQGGWENRVSVDKFAFYAQTAFEQFGDIVSHWTTFNEPMVHIECGYLGEFHYPAIIDFKKAVQVGFHTLMAHTKAVEIFKKGKYSGKIGCILNLSPVYAKNDEEKHQQAKETADLLYIRSLLDPMVLGTFPEELVHLLKNHDLLPTIEKEDLTLIQTHTIDFLGVNYYQPMRVQYQDKPRSPIRTPEDLFQPYDWPEKIVNPHRGWEIYPKGIYDIAHRMKQDYQNIPWYISENGMGVEGEEKFMDETGIIQDDYRIEFIQEHLEFLHQAISEGANCFGYHLWTFVDCWSWLNGYKNRYGFYRVDIENDYQRTPKKSSYWMRNVIKNNAIN